MTRSELTKLAAHGIEKKIESKCANIACTGASPANVVDLKMLIEKYDEIMQEYDVARMEENAHA